MFIYFCLFLKGVLTFEPYTFEMLDWVLSRGVEPKSSVGKMLPSNMWISLIKISPQQPERLEIGVPSE